MITSLQCTLLILAMSNPFTCNGYGKSSTASLYGYGLVGKCSFHWFFVMRAENTQSDGQMDNRITLAVNSKSAWCRRLWERCWLCSTNLHRVCVPCSTCCRPMHFVNLCIFRTWDIRILILNLRGIHKGALCYKPAGRGFDSRWGQWICQLT
jgi:hypothetical protein